MILWGLRTCDTCRKALKALEAAGRRVDFRDVRADGLPDDLEAWIAEFGAESLVNRRSTTWKALDDATRARADDPEGAAAVLQANPTLVKRPLIESGSTRSVGWTDAVRTLHI